MDTETRLSGFGLSLLGIFLVIAIVFASNASIGDRATNAKMASFDAHAIPRILPKDLPEASASNPATGGAERSNTATGAVVRTKVHCAGCGVVESVRRIERREIADSVCHTTDSERFWMPGNAGDASLHGGVVSPTGASVFTGRPGARMPLVRSTYQIVVRFRDGSRHVFNEATPRTLRLGEPVQVIAGADLSINDRP
jgi:hypothetical protein